MKKALILCAPALFASAAPSGAVDYDIAARANVTDYSKGFGSRRETTAESTTRVGDTSFTLGASQAKRKYGDDSFSAFRVAGTIYHNWTDRLYTRTYGSLSSNKPVFATRELGTDFNLKVLPGTVATVGAKAARYYGRRDALSWSAGATHYFRGGFATYRFTAYDVEGLGKSRGHMATLRIRDGGRAGSTQLWLGAGNSVHEELLSADSKGTFRSVAVQRVQPIKGPVSMTFTLGRTWYDTPAGNFHGTQAAIGLTLDGNVLGARAAAREKSVLKQ